MATSDTGEAVEVYRAYYRRVERMSDDDMEIASIDDDVVYNCVAPLMDLPDGEGILSRRLEYIRHCTRAGHWLSYAD